MKSQTASILFALLLTGISCAHGASRQTETPANQPRDHWVQWATPEDAGFGSAELATLKSSADTAQSAAVMAVYDGRVLVAWGDVGRKLELASVRKSLYSALWGIAEARGLVDLDATLATLGVDDDPPLTTEEKTARLIDLLHSRSGVYHHSAYAPTSQEANLPERGSHPPGTFWSYNNWDFNVAGALLEKVTGKPLGVLFDEWIATPIGMEDFEPGDVFAAREPGRSRWPALTFRMSARDLARFGQLWLDDGRWGERKIIPADWVARASAPASETGEPGQGYATMWWTYEPGSLDVERYPNASRTRVVLGRGTGGQTVFVIPDAHLVVVHRGDTDHGRLVEGRDVWTMVDGILGARRGPPNANAKLTALQPEPFSSQLPEFEWPTPIQLSSGDAETLAGQYEFRPGMVGRVFLHDGRLFASMPGRGEAELFALSPTEFFLRVDSSAKVRFENDANGRPSRVIVTIRGRELVGNRIDGR